MNQAPQLNHKAIRYCKEIASLLKKKRESYPFESDLEEKRTDKHNGTERKRVNFQKDNGWVGQKVELLKASLCAL